MKITQTILKILPLGLLFSPSVLLAQLSAQSKFSDVSKFFVGILTSLIPLLIGVGLLVFFWGLIKFIYESNSPESIKEGKNVMFWGVIIMFVMVSIWGIIKFLSSSIGIQGTP